MPRKSKPTKTASSKPKKIRFELVIEAQRMLVDYQPHWMRDTGHFEFRSPHDPARRIPVNETGYRSHFAAMEEVEAAASPQEYARLAALAIMGQRAGRRVEKDSGQLALF
jgi:hypothetical protein